MSHEKSVMEAEKVHKVERSYVMDIVSLQNF